MERGKPLQEGVRVKLSSGVTWEQLATMSPDAIRERGLWPKGFLPLPHPFHSTGGFVFPQEEIDAIKRQDGRDLTRFDVSFDLPQRFLAGFPPAMYLVQRPDLGDVSQGKLVSLTNFFEMFNGILTPRQLEGLRLLLTPSARLASIAIPTAIRTALRTLPRMHARSGSATASGRYRSAASTSSGCSARSVP
jgi:cytochrome c peroxidase